MNDTLNKCWLELEGLLSPLSDNVQRMIRNKVKSIVELEQKNVRNLVLLDINAYYLRKGDLVLNLDTKKVSKVKFCDYRINCQFNIEKSNKEILVEYEDDTAIDYYNENTQLVLLIDVADIVNIHNRPEPEWEYEEEL
jgi:wobble nucleotide-excising tRNase